MSYPFYISWQNQGQLETLEILDQGDYWLETPQGKVFDFSSISFQCSFGLKPKIIQKAVAKQCEEMPVASAKAVFDLKTKVSEGLLDYLELPQGKIFYTVSGSEAVENALKMARTVSKKNIVLSLEQSYHGSTMGALSATGDWRRLGQLVHPDHRWLSPSWEDPGHTKNKKLIEEVGAQNIAAICLETISGANGVYSHPKGWWQELEKICLQNDIFLIVDEIVCGFHRTGKPFAFQHYDITPDFVCMAKAISGGVVPFGAVYTSPKISEYFDHHMLPCGLTNYAHPLGLASAKATLDIVQSEPFLKHYKKLEGRFQKQITKWKKLSSIKEIRQQGLLACLDLNEDISRQELTEAGLSCYHKEKRLILAPALTYPEDLFKDVLKNLSSLLGQSTKLKTAL